MNEDFALKVKELRKSYGLSLDYFAKIIGCAKKTLITYEQGKSFPNESYLATFNLLFNNPDFIINLFNSNVSRFNEKEYKYLYSKLSKFRKSDLSIYNGFTNISIEKINNLILLLSKNGIYSSKLIIEMLYIDLLMYKRFNVSITGLEYIKNKFNIVPFNFNEILNDMINSSMIDYKLDFLGDYESYSIFSINKYERRVFNEDELNVIDSVRTLFDGLSVRKSFEMLYKSNVFIDSKINDKINYDLSFNL